MATHVIEPGDNITIPTITNGDILVFRPKGRYIITGGLAQSTKTLARLVAEGVESIQWGGNWEIGVTEMASFVGRVAGAFSGAFATLFCGRGSEISFSGGSIIDATVDAASLVIGSAVAFTGTLEATRGASVDALANATEIPSVMLDGGAKLITRRSIESGYVADAMLSLRSTATISDGSAGGQLVVNHPRAILEVRDTPGTIDSLDARKGRAVLDGLTGNLTVSALNINASSFAWPERISGRTITVTARKDLAPLSLSLGTNDPPQNTLGV